MVSQIKKTNKLKNFSVEKQTSSFFSSRSFFFGLLFLIGIFGLAYIFQVNKIAVMGYEIKLHEDQAKSIEEENNKLKIELVSLQSIYVLEEKKDDLKMVSPGQVDYLELNDFDKLVLAK